MQLPWAPSLLLALSRTPTVGRLVDLCEENYRLLGRLLPAMSDMRGSYASCHDDHSDLHVEVLEQSRYTTLLHMTYYFEEAGIRHADPDVVVRVYHDAQQVELMDLRQSVLPVENLYEAPGLLNKWQANLFLSKWLSYCVQQGHFFNEKLLPRCKQVI